jgi:hypothetical protein
MIWNLDNISFLHRPDDFVGAFTNKHMQERHLALQEKKINDINTQLLNETDPAKAMRVLNRQEYTQFVLNNMDKFKEASSLEKTVLELYFHDNSPFAPTGKYETWTFLFEKCDQELLSKEGVPLSKKTITGYRGSVTGVAKGLSWTVDEEKVRWILNRWSDKDMGGGTVFKIEVSTDDILVYLEDSVKKEFILAPHRVETITPVEVSAL